LDGHLLILSAGRAAVEEGPPDHQDRDGRPQKVVLSHHQSSSPSVAIPRARPTAKPAPHSRRRGTRTTTPTTASAGSGEKKVTCSTQPHRSPSWPSADRAICRVSPAGRPSRNPQTSPEVVMVPAEEVRASRGRGVVTMAGG